MASTAERDGRIEQRRRRVVGVVVLLGVAAIAAFVWGRFALSDATDAAWLARGAEALQRALDGDPTGFGQAEDAFEQAAGESLFDPYPIFCVAATDDLRRAAQARVPVPDAIDDLDDVHALLVNREHDRARTALLQLAAGEDGDRRLQAQLYLRLHTDLEVARRRAQTPP